MRKTFGFFLKWSFVGIVLATLFIAYRNPSLLSRTINASRQHIGWSAGFSNAAQIAAPAVVSIRTTTAIKGDVNPLLEDPLFRDFFNVPKGPSESVETGVGSGVVVGRSILVTNHHVIEGVHRITVVLHDGRRGSARVIGSDPETDLAVLSADLELPPPIGFADQSEVEVGDIVLAIGNPLGIGQTVTQGIVSATGRDRIGINTFENFIQTDAAINPGNSGGALVNTKGQLVGVNAAILGYQGIGFAIPSTMVNQVLRQLLLHGEVTRGWLGIDARDLSPALGRRFGILAERGIIVLSVMPQGPAAKAGIKNGDVITEIDGVGIADSRDALNRISELSPRQETTITLERQNETIRATVMVESRPNFKP